MADFSPVISPADSPIPVYSIQQCSIQEPVQYFAVSMISSSEQTSSSSSIQSRLVSSEALNLNQELEKTDVSDISSIEHSDSNIALEMEVWYQMM